MNLSFIQPSTINGSSVARPPQSVFQHGIKAWEPSLIGYFLDKRLPYARVEPLVKKLWHHQGLSQVLVSPDGSYIFRFHTVEQCTKILENGPYHLLGNPLILKAWEPNMTFSKDLPKTVPLWVHLHNIPLELWSAQGLSHIASVLGKPLYADNSTASFSRIHYAKVCVEMDLAKDFPSQISLETPSNELLTINVDYPWLPRRCTSCNLIGHLTQNCPTKPLQIWRVKNATITAQPKESKWVEVKRSTSLPSTQRSRTLSSPNPSPSASNPTEKRAALKTPLEDPKEKGAETVNLKMPILSIDKLKTPMDMAVTNKYEALMGFDDLDSYVLEEAGTLLTKAVGHANPAIYSSLDRGKAVQGVRDHASSHVEG